MLRILVVACLVGTGAYGAPQRGVQIGSTGRPHGFGGPTAAPGGGPNYQQHLNFGGPTSIPQQQAAAQNQQQRYRIPQTFQPQQPIILSQINPSGAPAAFSTQFGSSTPFPIGGQRGQILPLRSPIQTTTAATDDDEYEDEEYEDEPQAPRPTQPGQFNPTIRTVPQQQRGPPVRISQPQQQIYNQQPQRLIQQNPQPQQIQRRPVQQQRPLAPQPTPQQLQSLQPLAPRQPQQRPQGQQHQGGRNRVTTPPPVQTLNRYMRNNDDGSITWGYENEDGTFKEETLGADCVVRGKYGYVDPDGNKREYEYQSGNPCDPNKRGQEEEEDQLLDGPEEQQLPQQPRFAQGPRPLSARRPQQQLQQQGQ